MCAYLRIISNDRCSSQHLGKNKQISGEKEKLQYNLGTDRTLQALMHCAFLCNDANFTDRLPLSIVKGVMQEKSVSLAFE